MDITIYSRSNSDYLFDKMSEFIPSGIKMIKCSNFQDWQDASRYLYHIIDNAETDWIMNVDTDCFIIDWTRVIKLYEYMKANEIAYCGMREGGVHPGRSWSWCAINPFFNIFNAKKIKDLKMKSGLTWQQIEQFQFLPEFELRKPLGLEPNCNNIPGEPFHGLFFWLFSVADGYFMDVEVFDDEVANFLLGLDGTRILLHTWYSRNYAHDDDTRTRIDNLLLKAEKMKLDITYTE